MVLIRGSFAFSLALGISWQAEAGIDRSLDVGKRDNLQRRDNETTNPRDEAEKHPNATGTWPFRGIDVTKPLLDPPIDEFGRGNGWNIKIAVTTNITTEEGSTTRANPQHLTLEAPENAFEGADSTTNATENYEICAVSWFANRWSVKEMEKLHQDADGSCNGVLPESCITDLRRTLLDTRCGIGSSYKKPDSCPEEFSSSNALQNDVRFRANESSFGIGGNMGPYTNGSEELIKDAYDEAVTKVYPVMLVYKYDDGETTSNYTVFRCVRANDIAEGSRQPETFGSRRGSAGHVEMSLCTLITGLIASFSVTFFI